MNFGVHMGFGIEGEITKIYNTYVQKHPECSVLSPDAVYLRMKEERVITQEQYNSIKKGLIFDFKSQKSETDGDWKSAFGLQTKQLTKTNSVKQNNVKQKTHHPVYKDLLLDSKGKIDMNQFSVETIKQKYSKGGYIIDYKKSDDEFSYEKSSIEIKDSTGKKVLSLSYNSDGSTSQTSYKNGKEFNYYSIENGIVTTGRHTETDGSYVQYIYEKDGKTIKGHITENNGIYTEKTYNKGELTEIYIQNAKINKTEIKKYKHGVLVINNC